MYVHVCYVSVYIIVHPQGSNTPIVMSTPDTLILAFKYQCPLIKPEILGEIFPSRKERYAQRKMKTRQKDKRTSLKRISFAKLEAINAPKEW